MLITECTSRHLQQLSGDCRYREIDETHHLIQWFWEILESFSNDERILFMRFVSGRSRLPMNPADITQRFQILKIDRVSAVSFMLSLHSFRYIIYLL